eukprot:TRINITY_DN59640_c0_g1_i1.p1 TRINITY_DN59640_c0_g1~~TRINITY_DN59640_c0_g1_i1.p1  ORF type:complete len:118 (+),score=5.65 TRINITY_DN59640_c0_g1_i1:154-507(+)
MSVVQAPGIGARRTLGNTYYVISNTIKTSNDKVDLKDDTIPTNDLHCFKLPDLHEIQIKTLQPHIHCLLHLDQFLLVLLERKCLRQPIAARDGVLFKNGPSFMCSTTIRKCQDNCIG